MDSLEFSKIAGAILSALLVIFGVKTFIDIKLSHPAHTDAKAGYKLPVQTAAADAKGAAAGAAAPAPAAFSFAKVAELLPKASADNGKAVFKKCASCHTADQGGKNMVGPNLYGVMGRKMGAVEGFGYSEDLKAKGGEWTPETLAQFINNPKGLIAKTKMVFAGLADPAEIADLLAFLKAQGGK